MPAKKSAAAASGASGRARGTARLVGCQRVFVDILAFFVFPNTMHESRWEGRPKAQCFHQNRIQLLSITKKKKTIRFISVVRQDGPIRSRCFHFVSLNRKAKSIISLRYKSMILHTTLAGNISNLCYPLCAINLEACAGGRGRDGTCGLPLQWLRWKLKLMIKKPTKQNK